MINNNLSKQINYIKQDFDEYKKESMSNKRKDKEI